MGILNNTIKCEISFRRQTEIWNPINRNPEKAAIVIDCKSSKECWDRGKLGSDVI